MPLPRRLALLALPTLLAACASTPTPDATAVLRQAEQATGAAAVRSLHFSGRGTGTTFGQAYQPGITWPGLNYSLLARQMDYDNAALREDFARSRSEPTGGGATPLMGQGEARVTAFVRGTVAWNGSGAAATAAPVAVDTRIHDLWTTPHGAVKAAMRNQPRAATRSEGGTSLHHGVVHRTRPLRGHGVDRRRRPGDAHRFARCPTR
jgi:hypothetical protein